MDQSEFIKVYVFRYGYNLTLLIVKKIIFRWIRKDNFCSQFSLEMHLQVLLCLTITTLKCVAEIGTYLHVFDVKQTLLLNNFHATHSDQHHSSPRSAQTSTKFLGIEILITFNMICLCESLSYF